MKVLGIAASTPKATTVLGTLVVPVVEDQVDAHLVQLVELFVADHAQADAHVLRKGYILSGFVRIIAVRGGGASHYIFINQ